MRKGLTAAICIGAVALPAAAVGGPMAPDPEYGGKLEDKRNRYVGFDVTGSGGDRKIKNTFVVNMRFDCQGEMNDGPQSGELSRAVKVKPNGSFDDTITYEPRPVPIRGGPEKIRYRLAGDLQGGRANGFIRIELLGGPTPCDSGKQDFKVKKPAPPPPDPSEPRR
jgi:hypothetical protein